MRITELVMALLRPVLGERILSAITPRDAQAAGVPPKVGANKCRARMLCLHDRVAQQPFDAGTTCSPCGGSGDSCRLRPRSSQWWTPYRCPPWFHGPEGGVSLDMQQPVHAGGKNSIKRKRRSRAGLRSGRLE